jgi:molybdopterin converting factor subunit 1
VITVTVKLFALSRDLAGTNETILSLPQGATTATLLEYLIGNFPGLLQWKDHLRIAVNSSYAANDEVLHDKDEVAVIPPVSGG